MLSTLKSTKLKFSTSQNKFVHEHKRSLLALNSLAKKSYCPKKEPIYHTAVHSGVVVDTCFTYLALVCSSSDLELDHLRLEPEMKEATALFALNRLIVPREQNWVGMGSTSYAFEFVCMCACSHMHPDTCACLRKVI